MKKKLKIVFAGTPDISSFVLEKIIQNEKYLIQAIFTQPDRRKGRGKKVTKSPTKLIGEKYNIPIFQPQSLKNNIEMQQILKNLNCDLMLVIAYGLILPKEILNIPKYGCINIHASLLPKYRGAAPIQRAILNKEKETGITIMQMDEGLDSGDILYYEKLPISNEETSLSLFEKFKLKAPITLFNFFDIFLAHKIISIKQDLNKATYANKIEKQEALINFNDNAINIDYKIRGYNPYPICFINKNNKTIKIHKAKVLEDNKIFNIEEYGKVIKVSKNGLDICTKKGILRILEMQFPNKNKMNIENLINGYDLKSWENSFI